MIHESKKTDLFDIKLAKLKVPAHGASEAAGIQMSSKFWGHAIGSTVYLPK